MPPSELIGRSERQQSGGDPDRERTPSQCNRALLHRQQERRLSPACDRVPSPVVSLERRDLALSIGDHGRTASVYNLTAQAGRFGLSATDARAEIDRLVGWPCVRTQWQPCEMPAQGMMKHEAWGSTRL